MGCLVSDFKPPFSVFKQHLTHFNALFHPHIFSKIFLNDNFQFLNTYTKRTHNLSHLCNSSKKKVKKKRKSLSTILSSLLDSILWFLGNGYCVTCSSVASTTMNNNHNGDTCINISKSNVKPGKSEYKIYLISYNIYKCEENE